MLFAVQLSLMTQEEIKAKQTALELQFNNLTARKTELETELTNTSEEMFRLQGEYRAFSSLLDTPNNESLSITAVEDILVRDTELELLPSKPPKSKGEK